MGWCPRITDATCYIRRGWFRGRCRECRVRPADYCCSPCCECCACWECCDLRRSVCFAATIQFLLGGVLGGGYTSMLVLLMHYQDKHLGETVFFAVLLYLVAYWWLYFLSGIAGCCVTIDKQGITTYEPRVLLMSRIYLWLTLLCAIGHLDLVVLGAGLWKNTITTISVIVSVVPALWDWYMVYLAWSMLRKLQEQRRGIFRGKPVMRNQRKPDHVLELHAAHQLELRPPPDQIILPLSPQRGTGPLGARWSAPGGDASIPAGNTAGGRSLEAAAGEAGVPAFMPVRLEGDAAALARHSLPPAASDVSSEWNVRDSSVGDTSFESLPQEEDVSPPAATDTTARTGSSVGGSAAMSGAARLWRRAAAVVAGGGGGAERPNGGEVAGLGWSSSGVGLAGPRDTEAAGPEGGALPAPLSVPLPPPAPLSVPLPPGPAVSDSGSSGSGSGGTAAAAGSRLYGMPAADALMAIEEEDAAPVSTATDEPGPARPHAHTRAKQQQKQPQQRQSPAHPAMQTYRPPPVSVAAQDDDARPTWPRRLFHHHHNHHHHYQNPSDGGALDRPSKPTSARSAAPAATAATGVPPPPAAVGGTDSSNSRGSAVFELRLGSAVASLCQTTGSGTPGSAQAAVRPHNPPLPAVEPVVLSVPSAPAMYGKALFARVAMSAMAASRQAGVPTAGDAQREGGAGAGAGDELQRASVAVVAVAGRDGEGGGAGGGYAAAVGDVGGGPSATHSLPPGLHPPGLGRRTAFLRTVSLQRSRTLPPRDPAQQQQSNTAQPPAVTAAGMAAGPQGNAAATQAQATAHAPGAGPSRPVLASLVPGQSAAPGSPRTPREGPPTANRWQRALHASMAISPVGPAVATRAADVAAIAGGTQGVPAPAPQAQQLLPTDPTRPSPQPQPPQLRQTRLTTPDPLARFSQDGRGPSEAPAHVTSGGDDGTGEGEDGAGGGRKLLRVFSSANGRMARGLRAWTTAAVASRAAAATDAGEGPAGAGAASAVPEGSAATAAVAANPAAAVAQLPQSPAPPGEPGAAGLVSQQQPSQVQPHVVRPAALDRASSPGRTQSVSASGLLPNTAAAEARLGGRHHSQPSLMALAGGDGDSDGGASSGLALPLPPGQAHKLWMQHPAVPAPLPPTSQHPQQPWAARGAAGAVTPLAPAPQHHSRASQSPPLQSAATPAARGVPGAARPSGISRFGQEVSPGAAGPADATAGRGSDGGVSGGSGGGGAVVTGAPGTSGAVTRGWGVSGSGGTGKDAGGMGPDAGGGGGPQSLLRLQNMSAVVGAAVAAAGTLAGDWRGLVRWPGASGGSETGRPGGGAPTGSDTPAAGSRTNARWQSVAQALMRPTVGSHDAVSPAAASVSPGDVGGAGSGPMGAFEDAPCQKVSQCPRPASASEGGAGEGGGGGAAGEDGGGQPGASSWLAAAARGGAQALYGRYYLPLASMRRGRDGGGSVSVPAGAGLGHRGEGEGSLGECDNRVDVEVAAVAEVTPVAGDEGSVQEGPGADKAPW